MEYVITLEEQQSALRPVDFSAFGLRKPLQPSGPVAVFRRALILKPGTYNGHSFTAQDCLCYAKNFEANDPPPVVVDHKLNDANECHGYVRALVYDSQTQALFGLIEFLGSHAVDRVADGRWRRISGRFVMSQVPERKKLTEVSVTLRPACGDAALLSVDGAPGCQVAEEAARAVFGLPTQRIESDQELTVAGQEARQEVLLSAARSAMGLKPA